MPLLKKYDQLEKDSAANALRELQVTSRDGLKELDRAFEEELEIIEAFIMSVSVSDEETAKRKYHRQELINNFRPSELVRKRLVALTPPPEKPQPPDAED